MMGLHNWKCIISGMYDDLLKCEHCGEEFMEQADNFPHGQAPKDGCEKAPPTDAERIAALEAEVADLKKQVAALQQSLAVPPEVRPVELDPQLVQTLREVLDKIRKGFI